MTLTKNYLNQYKFLDREIRRIENKIDYYTKNPVSSTHGVVKGSMRNFPFAECHFVVSAPDVKSDEERNIKIKNLVIKLGEMKKEYEKMELDIDIEIEKIEDIEIRQIIQSKYIEGMTDSMIGDELGYDRSTISKRIEKFFENQVSHNSHLKDDIMIV
jgi:hypothetical protein